MKCWFHPEMDAVGVCKSCGRGVCKECSVTIEGNTYCKNCVESGRVAVPAPAVAKPKPPPTVVPPPAVAKPKPPPVRAPSKGQFIAGGIGSVFNIISSISLSISALSILMGGYSFFEIPFDILLVVGLILAGIGYLGIRRNYGSSMGTASFAFSIIVMVSLIISIIVDVAITVMVPIYGEWLSVIVGIIWFILFGIMQILWGATHIVTRDFTGKSGLSLATGIMLIIAGSLTMTWMLSIIGIPLFFIAEIMASVLFFISDIPEAAWP